MKKNKFISLLGIVSLFAGVSSCTKINNNANSSTASSTTTSSSTSSSSPSTPDVPKEITTDENSFEYSIISGGNIRITGLKRLDYDYIVIPDEIDGKPVTEFSDDITSFKNNSRIKSFKLNKNIKSGVDGSLFLNSTNLKTIEVDEENPTYKVENNLLMSRSPLTEGENLYELNYGLALLNDENLVIPNYIGKLGSNSLIGATSKKISIPSSVTDISNSTFTYCSNLEEFELIGDNSKYQVENNCLVFDDQGNKTVLAGTKKSTIPDDCNTIAAYAFNGIDIKNLSIKNNITTFKSGRCFKDSGLEELHFADDVKLTGGFNYALIDASKLKIIDWPTGAQIYQGYFMYSQLSGCTSLTNVNFKGVLGSNNTAWFRRRAFPDTTNAITFDFGPNTGYSQDSDKYVYHTENSKKTLIGYFGSSSEQIENLTTPDVDIIQNYAFYKTNIKNIKIHPNTTELKDDVFESSNIETLDFGNVTKIGSGTFYGCENLQTITWSNKINEIPGHTFTQAHVKKLIIGANVTLAHSFRTIDGGYIDYIEVDENNKNYSASSDHLSLLSKDGKIAYFLFPDKDKNITIPDGVEELYEYGFYEREINEVKGGKDLKTIDANAFEKSTIVEIEIPEKVETIGERAFQYCKKLEKITFKNPNTKLGVAVFASCTSLKTIELPSNLQEISEGLFQSTIKLTSLVLNENVNSVGKSAFYGSSLTDLTIKNPNITLTKKTDKTNSSFYSANQLNTITFYGTLEQFKAAFGSTKEEYSLIIDKSIIVKFKSSESVSEPDTTKTTDEIYAE